MAYVTPTVRTTGDLITAAIWNQDVVANPIALSTALLIPEQRSGQAYFSQTSRTPISAAESANILKATPITIPSSGTYDRIGVWDVDSGAGNSRLGIYLDNAGVPGALLLDAGVVSVATAGSKSATISQALAGPQKYWLAVVYDNTPTIAQWDDDHTLPAGMAGYGRAFTYGALPDPFAGTTWYSNATQMFLRKA